MSLNKKKTLTGAPALVPTEHRDGKTYFGNSGTKTVTGYSFAPDMIHIKNRDQADPNIFFDTTRGNGYYFLSDTYHSMPASLSQGITFTSDGFSANAHGYINGAVNYMSWGWKANGGTTSSNTDGTITTTVQANPDAGFSIMRYNGNYTQGATIGHGLGVAPWIWITVRISHAENKRSAWGGVSGQPLQVTLDNASGMQPGLANTLYPAASSSTVITLGNDPSVNYNSSYQYICYAWAPIAGYSAMGEYNGNGSTQQITTGFQPRLVWLKRKDSTGDWFMIDSHRGNNKQLNLNDTTTEVTDTRLTFNSTGFQLNATAATNGSGTSHYYCAWA
mgnify:CR=1 FL=1